MIGRFGLVAIALLTLAAGDARAQQCLGVPIAPDERSLAFRFQTVAPALLAGELVSSHRTIAWSALIGGAADDVTPPDDLSLALGGGLAWTSAHRVLCPAASVVTWSPEVESFSPVPRDTSVRHTFVRLGIGFGRRLGEAGIRGAAWVHPHVQIDRTDAITRNRFAIEGGGTLRGERLWGRVSVQLVFPDTSVGEDVPGTGLGLTLGVAL